METRLRRQVSALALLLVVSAVGGCATTAAERCASGPEPVEVPGEMTADPRPPEAWLRPDDAALRLKLDPRGWTPLARAVAEVIDGMEAQALPPATALLGQVVPPGPALESVDLERPSWLVLSARGDRLFRTCLGAGLPCTRDAYEIPLYARLLLPSRDPAALATALRETLGRASRVVRHRDFVRVELAVGVQGESEPVAADLDARAAGRRDRGSEAPDTPALRAFRGHDGLLAIHGDLGRVLGLAQHVGARALAPSLARVDPSRAVGALAQGTWILNLATSLDEPERAEVRDAALLLGLADGAPALDLVGTRTPFGRRLLEAARFAPEMTPSRVEEPVFTLDWAMDPEAVREADGIPEWLDEGPESLRSLVRPLGVWLLAGVARHPVGVVGGLLAPPMAGRDDSEPPTLLALRIRAEPRPEVTPEEEVLLRGGAALLFPRTERTTGLLTMLRMRVGTDDRYAMDVRDRGDRVEVLVSYGAAIEEVFRDEATGVDWSTQGARMDLARLMERAEFLKRLLWQIRPILPIPVDAGVPPWLPRAPLVLTLGAGEDVSGLRLALGRDPGGPPMPAGGDASVQPAPTCLDLLFRDLAPIVDAAAHGRRSASVLRVGLDGVRATLEERVAGCAGPDAALARLAVAHVDWLRARLADEAGQRDEADALDEQACEAGHCPACLDPRGAWLGARPAEADAAR
ncbi:MAG: hypothetical protein ACQEXJ_19460 [Myxococcota bacterium]